MLKGAFSVFHSWRSSGGSVSQSELPWHSQSRELATLNFAYTRSDSLTPFKTASDSTGQQPFLRPVLLNTSIHLCYLMHQIFCRQREQTKDDAPNLTLDISTIKSIQRQTGRRLAMKARQKNLILNS